MHGMSIMETIFFLALLVGMLVGYLISEYMAKLALRETKAGLSTVGTPPPPAVPIAKSGGVFNLPGYGPSLEDELNL